MKENQHTPDNGTWHTKSVKDVLNEFNTDTAAGLNNAEAFARLNKYGPNELIETAGKKPIRILLEQFTSTLVIILIIAALISGLLGKPTETFAIAAIVLLFGILGFVQEHRAEKAMAALKKLTVPRVKLYRNGIMIEISARDLVPGDIIALKTGNIVPADVRMLECVNLRIQESTLTGESEPVDKSIDALDKANVPLGDRKNLAYMGTIVTYGHGTAIVVATGMRTELGKIARLIQGVKTSLTPLQRRLNQVGKVMALLGISVAALIMIVGIMNGQSLNDMFLIAVSVAVAVVPEGLPAVVTVTLALGAQRMLKRNSLVRRLPAVETLGSVTVICSDKTGTLTENRMTVMLIDVAGQHFELSEFADKHPVSSLKPEHEKSCQTFFDEKPKTICMTLLGGALCNDATLQPDPETDRVQMFGDPTEGALLVAASYADIYKSKLYKIMTRVAELPFDSIRKRMTTVHKLPDDPSHYPPPVQFMRIGDASHISFTKGAVDCLLDVSSHVWVENGPVPLNKDWRRRIQIANDEIAQKGMRVLGVAIRWLDSAPAGEQLNHLEENLIYIGLIGMIDPPRREVKSAVATCQQAKIRPVMITGDHPLTARFIANELGIRCDKEIITGQDLNAMSDADLKNAVENTSIFARVSPEHKLRIVSALQSRGEIVAMTGDGVNDSPALKKADIGIAMGITGTDVSKEASDMVLLDDNFSTIVAAVEEGRVIYDNIRRFVKFSIAGNLGKVLVMLLMPLFGITIALLPLQLLWLNLLTDGLLGLGLGLEPAERNTMHRPPRNPKAHFISEGLGIHVLWVGILIGMIALAVGFFYHHAAGPANLRWQTMIFTVLAFLQVGQALGSRAMQQKTFSLDFRSNPTIWIMIFAVILLQMAVIYVPLIARFFNVIPLSLTDLALCFGLIVFVYVPVKIEKILRKGKAI